jgi:hypothetical protein
MSTILFIVMCVLAIINIIIYTFVASAIHKRDLCQKSPYYHCDTDWICCMSGKANCDTNPGVQIGTNAYYITDQIYGTGASGGSSSSAGGSAKGLKDSSTSGTDKRGLNLLTCNGKSGTYYELCVLPVQTVYKGYTGTSAPKLDCLYSIGTNDTQCIQTFQSFSFLNFVEGQCCYQKFDPSSNTPNSGYGNTLYPYGSNTSWNSTGLYGGNNYTNPTVYTFPQGSNTDTKNNSCYNSFFSHNKDDPNQFYDGCPPPPGS